MRDLLVTGTDTGVGKTLIAAALVTALRRRGVRAVGFKPVETGLTPGQSSDADLLARASEERNPLTAPVLQLHEALAPAVAADRAGVLVEPDAIESRLAELRTAGYTVVVEGAGGVMVPLAWNYSVLDLAQACDLDAIVVGRAGLGTLNHIAMTVMMLRSREIPLRGIVLNGRGDHGDVAEETNPAALRRMLHDVRIVEVPRFAAPDAAAIHAAAAVERLL